MELHTVKTSTYAWQVYNGEEKVGRIGMSSRNWVGPCWGCEVYAVELDGLRHGRELGRLHHAVYRLMYEIRGPPLRAAGPPRPPAGPAVPGGRRGGGDV